MKEQIGEQIEQMKNMSCCFDSRKGIIKSAKKQHFHQLTLDNVSTSALSKSSLISNSVSGKNHLSNSLLFRASKMASMRWGDSHSSSLLG